MSKVKIYKWRKFDANSNEDKIGPGMATREARKSLGNAVPIDGTEIEIDESVLDGNGMTPPGWVPPGQ